MRAAPLALGIVRFGQRYSDAAVVVPRHHLGPHAIGEKIEDEALGVLVARPQGQIEPQQAIEKPVLGPFDLAPKRNVPGFRSVGDDAVVNAGVAEELPGDLAAISQLQQS